MPAIQADTFKSMIESTTTTKNKTETYTQFVYPRLLPFFNFKSNQLFEVSNVYSNIHIHLSDNIAFISCHNSIKYN